MKPKDFTHIENLKFRKYIEIEYEVASYLKKFNFKYGEAAMGMDYCILPEYGELGLGLLLFDQYLNNLIIMGYKVSVGVIFN